MRQLQYSICAILMLVWQQYLTAQCTLPADQAVSVDRSLICQNTGVHVTLLSSDTGVIYSLIDSSTGLQIGYSQVGTGDSLRFYTGLISSGSCFQILAQQGSNGLDFDGVDETISLNTADNNALRTRLQGAAGMTIETWINMDYFFNEDGIFSFQQSGDGHWFWDNRSNGQDWFVGYTTVGSSPSSFFMPNPLKDTPGQWVHIAMVYDGANIIFYRNGEFYAAWGGLGSGVEMGSTTFTLGNYAGSNTYAADMQLDDFRVWSVARTQEEIKTGMNNCLTSKTNLELYYTFNHDSTITAIDSSGNGYDGNLNNFETTQDWIPATGLCNCSSLMNHTVKVNVRTPPPVNGGSDLTGCFGDSVALLGVGADSLYWTQGSLTIQNGGSYEVNFPGQLVLNSIDTHGCINKDTIDIVVNYGYVEAPYDFIVCEGDSVILTGSGALSYAWDNGVTDGVPFVADTTRLYTVFGTDSMGCTAEDNIMLYVDPLADDQIATAIPSFICDSGSSVIKFYTQEGYIYSFRDDATDSVIYGPFAGTGDTVSINSGILHQSSSYNILAVSPEYGLDLNGRNDYIFVRQSEYLASLIRNRNGFTIECTINIDTLTKEQGIFSFGNSGGSGVFEWYWTNKANGTDWVIGYSTSAGKDSFTISNPLIGEIGNWVNITMVYDGSAIHIYKNGQLFHTENSISGTVSIVSGSKLNFGRFGGYFPYWMCADMQLDEVRVWSKARTPSEIQASWDSCLASGDTNLLVLYTMEDYNGFIIVTNEVDDYFFTGIFIAGNDSNIVNGVILCDYCGYEMSTKPSVTVATSTSSTITINACNSYTVPSGNAGYSISGIYSDTITNAAGCDSFITIYLTINHTTYGSINPVTCNSYTVPSGNATYTTSGTYTDTIMNILGCDSIITINLTVNHTSFASIVLVVCDSYTVPSGNATYTTSGTYLDTIPNNAGCDSIITINLTVNYTFYGSITLIVCDSFVAPSGNVTYTTSGTYLDSVPNGTGCFVLITINLTVDNTSYGHIAPVVCDSYTTPSGNATHTTSGTYLDTIANAAGCDSIITINLMVNSTSFGSISLVVCDSFTAPSGNVTYTTSGTYLDTIANSAGCDSIITINLTVNHTSYEHLVPVVCNSYSTPSGNAIYTVSGTYRDTLVNTSGCDSIITISLTVNNTTYGSTSPVVCNSYTAPSGKASYTVSGTYYDTISNVAGCDSIITINLTANNTSFGSIAPVVCYSYTAPSSNTTYTVSGTYFDTITNVAGCDSIITIYLTVNNTSFGSISHIVCYSFTTPSGNATYTVSGTYSDTISNVAGCDSIITINLTVNNSTSSTITVSACETYTVPSGAATHTTSGTYMDVLTNVNGCDSLLTIHLTINDDQFIIADDVNICVGDSALIFGIWHQQQGTYYDTLTDSNGCDSFVQQDLVFIPLPVAQFRARQDSHVMYFDNLSENADDFFWDLGNGSTRTGVFAAHIYETTGAYTVTLVAGNECGTDTTSQLVNFVFTDINEIAGFAEFISIAPNPSNGNFTINLPDRPHTDWDIQIFNNLGALVYFKQVNTNFSETRIPVDLAGQADGTYFVLIRNQDSAGFQTRVIIHK